MSREKERRAAHRWGDTLKSDNKGDRGGPKHVTAMTGRGERQAASGAGGGDDQADNDGCAGNHADNGPDTVVAGAHALLR